MDAEQRQNDCVECARLGQELQALRERVSKLTAALEEERRRGKRQAAPFSKGSPVTEPKPPGRKSGKRHGPHAHRSVPPRIDETYDAPLPPTCPHCASRQVHETHVAVQYQTEIPRTVIYRRFDMQRITRCSAYADITIKIYSTSTRIYYCISLIMKHLYIVSGYTCIRGVYS